MAGMAEGAPRRRGAGAGALALAAALAALAIAPPPLDASTVLAVPLDEMARRADQILTGRVVGVRSQVSARRTSIHTFVTIEVDQWLKGGRGGSLVTLRVLGGEAGGYRLVVAGAPSFQLDEEVLVFTDGGAARVPTVFGLAQGKFRLETDPGTGERVLHRGLAGLNLADESGRTLAHQEAEPVALSHVEGVVRAALTGRQ